MTEQYYQQCLLYRDNRYMLSWIPTQFIKKHNILKLLNNGEWENNWMIITYFGTKITEDKLNLVEDQCFNTRETSDI